MVCRNKDKLWAFPDWQYSLLKGLITVTGFDCMATEGQVMMHRDVSDSRLISPGASFISDSMSWGYILDFLQQGTERSLALSTTKGQILALAVLYCI